MRRRFVIGQAWTEDEEYDDNFVPYSPPLVGNPPSDKPSHGVTYGRRWRKLRKLKIQECWGCCEVCGENPIDEVHHRRYGEDLTTKDLVAMCHNCHLKHHNKLPNEDQLVTFSVNPEIKDWVEFGEAKNQ